jgi:hypothetical protein
VESERLVHRAYADDADGADGVLGILPACSRPPTTAVRRVWLRPGGAGEWSESPLPSPSGTYAALVAGELAVREARPGDARAIAEVSVASRRWSYRKLLTKAELEHLIDAEEDPYLRAVVVGILREADA